MRLIAIATIGITLPATAAIIALYPLHPIPLAVALLVYAIALWRWTGLWLVVLPVIIPCLDLSPWTGWLLTSEVEPFVLVTIAVLSLRAQPTWNDVAIRGWPGWWLLAMTLVGAIGLAIGLAAPELPESSAVTFLTKDNAIRQLKGLALALALMPFIRQRQRAHQDVTTLLAAGMLSGLVGVGALVVLERALFVSVFDLTSDYRAAGPFASMQFGGGHIGGYLTMALPFLIWCLPGPGRWSTVDSVREIAPGVRLARIRDPNGTTTVGATRPSFPWGWLLLGAGAAVLGLYSLSVIFARTGLIATLIAMGAAAALYGVAVIHRRGAILLAGFGAALAFCVLGAVVMAVTLSPRLASRFDTTRSDLEQRRANWTDGLALMDRTVIAHLFGMGSGTYPRIVRSRAAPDHVPANVSLQPEGSTWALRLHPGSPLYLGQKITIAPGTDYRLTLWLRAPHGAASLRILLCEKWLLYSDDCRAREVEGVVGSEWHMAEMTIPSGDLGTARLFGLARPVEVAVTVGSSAHAVDVSVIALRDPAGRDMLSNGAWLFGLERWFLTDDSHLVWQMKSQFPMLWFEHGAVGLLVFLGITGCAILGAVRSALSGNIGAVPIAATLVGFLASGMLDYLMMAPRLSLLFWLMVMAGLALGRPAAPMTLADSGKPSERTI